VRRSVERGVRRITQNDRVEGSQGDTDSREGGGEGDSSLTDTLTLSPSYGFDTFASTLTLVLSYGLDPLTGTLTLILPYGLDPLTGTLTLILLHCLDPSVGIETLADQVAHCPGPTLADRLLIVFYPVGHLWRDARRYYV
jgi:hypothetical protein